MRNIVLSWDLFSPDCGAGNVQWSEHIVHRLLELMADSNAILLKCQGNKIPNIYEAGVIYQREPPGQELFNGIRQVIRDRGGDCDDLAAWRVAELRVRGSADYPNGEPAQFMLRKFVRPGKPLLYHVLVKRAPTKAHPKGWIEDPSKILGMPGNA